MSGSCPSDIKRHQHDVKRTKRADSDPKHGSSLERTSTATAKRRPSKSDADLHYYSHANAAYPKHSHSRLQSRPSMLRSSAYDDRRRRHDQHGGQQSQHHPYASADSSSSSSRFASRHDLPYDARHRSSDYDQLHARDFAAAPCGGPSRYAEMNMRAAFIPDHGQADEAPAPHFDRLALMDEDNEPRQYHLVIRQSPKHGQMCTLGSKNRRTLDPLPIIQLDLRDKHGDADAVGQNNPFLLMQVHLIADYIDTQAGRQTTATGALGSTSSASDSSSTSLDGKNLLPAPHDSFFSVQRLLEGKLVASAHTVWDEEADAVVDGSDDGVSFRESTVDSSSLSSKKTRSTFFIFSDLSIRMCGTYRLNFSLLRLGFNANGDDSAAAPAVPAPSSSFESSGCVVAQCTSPPFRVVHAREFTGISESTPLAKSFASQGVHIPIRNETKWRSRGRIPRESSTNESHSAEPPPPPQEPSATT